MPAGLAGLTQIQINGTASDLHLVSYALDLATSAAGPFTPIFNLNQNVSNGDLGILDTSSLANGSYLVRLTASDSAALSSTATQTVVVNNAPSGAGVRLVMGSTTQMVLNVVDSTAAAVPVDNPAVFVDETLPGSASSFNWSFVPAPVLTGAVSHTDSFADNSPGARLHYFIQAAPGYALTAGDNIIQYVYLSGASLPTEIMLGFYTGAGDGEHRVYWGQNLIQTGGIANSASMLYMGALPPAGQWIRLKIPASAVGLDGQTLTGVVYGAYGGRAFWDKTTSSHPNQDNQPVGASVLPAAPPLIRTNTTLTYALAKAAHLRIDVLEKSTEALVKTLLDSPQTAGTYTITWDQSDAQGNVAPEGDYFFRATSPDGPIDSEAIVFGSTVAFTGTVQPSATDADNNPYTLNASSGRSPRPRRPVIC